MLHEATRSDGVLRVTAPVLLVKPIRAGEGVSYGHTWSAPADGWTALIGIGYGNGVRRRAGNRATVLLGGERRPIVGRVAMNALVVWIEGPEPGVAAGDVAVLVGDPEAGEPTIEEWAAATAESVAETEAGFAGLLPGPPTPVPGASADIDLGAYRRNLRLLRDRIAPAELIAVVKNDAYGHGLAGILPAALREGVATFAVQDLETGRAARPLAPGARLIAWLWTPDELDEARELRLELGVHSLADVEAVADAYPGARVHLKIDTGLHRGGIAPDDWSAAAERAVELDAAGAIEVAGVFTHLAEAGEASDSRQLAAFRSAVEEVQARLGRRVLRHAAASAAGYARPEARFDAVRLGAFTYGIAPGAGIGPAQLGLEPVMRYMVGDEVVFGSQLRGEPTLQELADAEGTIGEELAVRVPRGVERRYRD